MRKRGPFSVDEPGSLARDPLLIIHLNNLRVIVRRIRQYGDGRILLLTLLVALAARFVLTYLNLSSGGPTFIQQLETYDDFRAYYIQWFHLLSSGLLPYRDFFVQYPPLFLYGLYPLYQLGGSYGVAFGIILADSGSAALIYLIVRARAGRKPAVVAGFGYALSPFALLYEGYLLWSMQPMLFFLLLSFLFLDRGKTLSSAAVLAVAVLFRQEAVFVFPAYILYLWRTERKLIVKGAIVLAGILLIVSLPFLVAAPTQYVSTMAYQQGSYPTNSSGAASISAITTVYNGMTSSPIPPSLSYHQVKAVLDIIFQWTLIPISLLVLPGLFVGRGKGSFVAFSSAYSIATLVMVFSYLGGFVPLSLVARYPYLPVYALLLVTGGSWKVPLTAAAFASVSLLLPPGVIQMALPFFAILAVMAVEDLTSKRVRGLPTEISDPETSTSWSKKAQAESPFGEYHPSEAGPLSLNPRTPANDD